MTLTLPRIGKPGATAADENEASVNPFAANSNQSASVTALDPPEVVTRTSTTPAATAGVMAVMVVSESTVYEATAVPPKTRDEHW